MALDDRYRNYIVSTLPPAYQQAYEAGRIEDSELELYALRLRLEPPPDFSNVEAASPSTEEDYVPEDTSYTAGGPNDPMRRDMDAIINATQGGAQSTLSGLLRLTSDPGAAPGFIGDAARSLDPFLDENIPGRVEAKRWFGEQSDRAYDASRANRKLVQQGLDEQTSGVNRAVVETLTDVAGTPSSLVSVFGGPAATIGGMDVYVQEYNEGIRNGMSPEAARERAQAMAGVETGISMMPAGKFGGAILERLGLGRKAADLVKSDGRVLAERIGKTAFGEGTEEAVTEAVQMGIDAGLAATTDNEADRAFSEANLPADGADAVSRMWRAFRAGAVGGGALGSPMEALQITAEQGRRASELLDQRNKSKVTDQFAQELNKLRDSGALDLAPVEEQMELFRDNTPQSSFEDQDAARRRELEIDAGLQIGRRRDDVEAGRANRREGILAELDQARQQQEVFQDRIRSGEHGQYNAQQTLSSLAAANRRVRNLENEYQSVVAQQEKAQQPASQLAPAQAVPAVQEDLFTNQERNELTQQKTESLKRISDGLDLIKKDNKAIEAKAKSTRAADRRKAQASLVESSRSMSATDRAQFLGDSLADWDTANPLSTYITKATTVAPKTKRGTTTSKTVHVPTQKKEPLKPNPKEAELEIQRQAMRENFPDMTEEQIEDRVQNPRKRSTQDLAQTGGTTTSTSIDDVFNSLVEKVGSGDVKILNKLMKDNNLRVVSNEKMIPTDAKNVKGAAGYYDGTTTYVVADKLDKKNIVGEMLNIAAHEVKHAADLSDNTKLKATLGEFIGKKANTEIVRKIEALAQAGNKPAQAAVEAARKGSTSETYSLELPAYYINVTRNQKDSTILAKRVVGDIVSAVRTKGKRVIGNADVNLKDVAYLSQKLLEETAIAGERLTSDKTEAGLPMILGRNARHFKVAEEFGLVYESRDGGRKFHISDKTSSIIKPDLSEKKAYKLGELLQHDELYGEYPELRDVKVQFFDTLPGTTQGSYHAGTNTIKLLSKYASDAAYNSSMHRFLIHETQHAIQATEGHEPGSNPVLFLDDEYWAKQRQLDEIASDLINVAGALHAGRLKQFGIRGDVDLKTQIDLTQETPNVISSTISALRELSNNKNTNTNTIQSLRANQVKKYLALRNELDSAEDVALEKYRNNLGEREATFAEHGIDTPQEEAPLNPEQTYFNDADVTEEVPALAFNAEALRRITDSFKKATDGTGPAESWGFRTFSQLLSSHGGLGTEIRNLRESARGLSAVFSHRAASYARRIDSGYKTIGRRTGETEEQVKAKVEKRLNSIGNLPDEQLRRTAIIALGRQYPEIRMPLMRSYATIKHLSSTIIRQMLEANPQPTEQEQQLMDHIADNNYGYTTRMFAMFQGVEGRKLARKMRKDVAKAEAARAKGKEVPERVQESFRVWNNARRFLIENDVAIPDAETLSKRRLDKVMGLYDLWFPEKSARMYKLFKEFAVNDGATVGESEAIARSMLEQSLLERKDDIDSQQIAAKADDLIVGMLEIGDTSNPIARYYRGFKEDRSILEHREKLPQEIRELFGEITDPSTRLAITMAKQGELVARARFFLDLRDIGKDKYVISKDKAGLPGNEKFSVELSGEAFGALDGWRTTPDIRAAISDQLEIYTSVEDALRTSFWNPDTYNNAVARATMKTVFGFAKWNKLATVVMDLWNGAQNAAGSPFMLIMNGVYNPKYWKEAAKLGGLAVADTIWQTDGTMSKDFEDLIRYELLDSARAQEIRSTPYDQVRKLLAEESGQGIWAKTKAGATAGGRFGIELYSMLDAWVKIAAFNHEVDYLKDFYKKAGQNKTIAQIKTEAADRTKDTNIGFSRTPGAVRALERIGAVTFLPYFVSAYRAIALSGVVAAKDFTKAADQSLPMEARMAAAAHASKRTAGMAAALGMLTHGMAAAVSAAIDDEDEEKIEKIKQLMYEDARYAVSLPIGEDDLGRPIFWRTSRIDPLGPATDVYRILLNDELAPEEKAKGMKDMFVGLIFANKAIINLGKLGADYAFDAGRPSETKLERVAPTATRAFTAALDKLPSVDNSDANSVTQFLNSFTPGFFDYFDPTVPKVAKEIEGVPGKEIAWIVNGLGGRLDQANPNLAAWAATKDLGEFRKNDGRPALNDAQLSLSNTAAMNIFLDKAAKEFELMVRVSEVYEGMTDGLGMKSSEAIKILKEASPGSLTTEDLGVIARGDIPSTADEWAKKHSRLLNKKSLQQRQSRYDKEATPEEQKKAEREREAWLKAFKAAGYNVVED